MATSSSTVDLKTEDSNSNLVVSVFINNKLVKFINHKAYKTALNNRSFLEVIHAIM